MASVNATTLQDLAKLCRVSKMTVSRALRGGAGVSSAVAERIRAAAEAHGYRANPVVGSVMKFLRQRKSPDYHETIAFIWTHRGGAETPGLAPWRDHARARAERLGFKLDDFFLRAPGMNGSRLRSILQARGIRGIVFAPDVEPQYPRVAFDVKGFAAVLVGSSLANRGLSRVQADHFQLAHLALRHMTRAGYRRPALILSGSMDARTQGRLRAAFLAHSPAPKSERFCLICDLEPRTPAALGRWLRECGADSLITIENGVLEELRRARFRIPQTLGFVSLAKRADTPDVAGVLQSAQALGTTAIDLLVAQLQRHEFGRLAFPQKVMLEGKWSPGETLPWRRRAPSAATSRPASRRSSSP